MRRRRTWQETQTIAGKTSSDTRYHETLHEQEQEPRWHASFLVVAKYTSPSRFILDREAQVAACKKLNHKMESGTSEIRLKQFSANEGLWLAKPSKRKRHDV